MPTLVLNGTTNGISRRIVIDRICFVDNGGPPLSKNVLFNNRYTVSYSRHIQFPDMRIEFKSSTLWMVKFFFKP